MLYEAPKRLRTDYRVGLSAWTDKSMLEEGSSTHTRRCRRKSACGGTRASSTSLRLTVVYAVPFEEMVRAWVERTPSGFLFNVKAYGLLTGHHVDLARLPDALRKMLPPTMRGKRAGRIPNSAFNDDARSWAFAELRKALRPLRQADKLGYVLFQLAPWLKRADDVMAYLATLTHELPRTVVAIEFRNPSWFGEHTEKTLKFLQAHGLSYVSIDGPRSRASVPSLPALTTPTAVFRLHGRNFQGFLKQLKGKAPTVAEKYDYLYERKELEEIARAAGTLNGRAEPVHLAMNNNRGDYPAINGFQLKEMLLEDWHPPDRAALIEELDERRAQAKGRGASRRRRAA